MMMFDIIVKLYIMLQLYTMPITTQYDNAAAATLVRTMPAPSSCTAAAALQRAEHWHTH
jgi:hypothetical protein